MKTPKNMAKHTIALAVAMAVIITVCCSSQPAKSTESANDAAPQQAAEESAQVTWTPDSDCASCHADESASTTDASMGAGIHAQSAQTTCTACHTDESNLAEAHKNMPSGATPKKLNKTCVSPEGCKASGCHDLSNEEMAALTQEVTELTDSKGTQVNPHEVMGLTEGHAEIVCTDCHRMHKENIGPAETCISCHHAGVYECNTCH